LIRRLALGEFFDRLHAAARRNRWLARLATGTSKTFNSSAEDVCGKRDTQAF